MGSIKATYSAIDSFASKCSDDYAAMINVANDILSRVEKMHNEVQQEHENICSQVVRAQMLNNEIEMKVKSYEHQMESAWAEVERYSSKIRFLLDNPSRVTSTDSEGNQTTSVEYDWPAIHEAERGRDEAMQTYHLFQEKYNEAFAVCIETQSTLNQFETIKNAINAVGESIKSDIFEIKKYIRAIEDETEYNTHSLQGVINSLSTYLASKAIFMPAGAHYENFVS